MNTNRRGFMGGASSAAVLSASGVAFGAEEVRRRRERHRDQDRPLLPLQRAGLGLRRDRQGASGVLQGGQRSRRHQRPQGQLHHARRRLLAAQDGRGGAPAGRAGEGAAALPDARHADQHGDPQVRQPEEDPASLHLDRRVEVGRSQALPVDHGLPARLPHRGRDLRQAHAGQRQGRQDRRPDAERRLRQGLLSTASRKGLGKEAGRIVKHVDLRGHRSDGRQPDHPAQGFRRQRVLQHLDAEVRRAGDPQGGRHRLEAGAVPEQRLGLGRLGDQAGRLRERARASSPRPTSRIRPTSSGTMRPT